MSKTATFTVRMRLDELTNEQLAKLKFRLINVSGVVTVVYEEYLTLAENRNDIEEFLPL